MTTQNLSKIFFPAMGIFLVVALWHLYVVQFNVSTVVLPKPSLVLDSIVSQRALLLSEGWITFKECLYGFALAMVLGIPIAVALTNSKILSLTFYPLLVGTQSIPKVAVAPIILVWLGTGLESKLAVAFLVAFFPVVVDTATGLRSTPPELLDLARSLRASKFQIFTKIQFPAALPFVFSGAKVAVTLAVIGGVIGEFVGSTEGLGNLLMVANSQINSPLAWASLVALSVLGILLFAAVVLAERIFMPWAEENRHG
ncbi:MAG: transporter permease [Deltaproteobacteria bacterium]|nr:transporter permease [Deltaproteobacteria bacterium]